MVIKEAVQRVRKPFLQTLRPHGHGNNGNDIENDQYSLAKEREPRLAPPSKGCPLTCFPDGFLLRSFHPSAGEFSVDSAHGGGTRSRMASFPCGLLGNAQCQPHICSSVQRGVCIESVRKETPKPLLEMTALDKMKGGAFLRSSLKTIWSSISIHRGDAAWSKCEPMDKINTGTDSSADGGREGLPAAGQALTASILSGQM